MGGDDIDTRPGTGPDQTPLDWASARPLLRPVPRPADFGLDAADTTGVRFTSRAVAPCLSEFVAVDLSAGLGYVTTELMAGWGVDAEEVFATAHANLAHAFAPLLDNRTPTPAVTYLTEPGDGYFSSLPLLDGWLTTWADAWDLRPVFIIAQCNTLLIAPEPTEAEQLVNQLAGAEEGWQKAERPLSPVLYTCDDAGHMIPYDLPDGSPFRSAVRRAWNLFADSVYAGQTDYLRTKAEFGDPFAAALQRFVETETGSCFTVATWAEDLMMTLLPEADWVAFVDQSNERIYVPWDDVARECGLVAAPGYHPTATTSRTSGPARHDAPAGAGLDALGGAGPASDPTPRTEANASGATIVTANSTPAMNMT